MARPPLDIGTHGNINYRWKGARCAAYAYYRDRDGETRKVERWGDTENKAKRALKNHFTERGKSPRGGTVLTAESTLDQAASVYLTGVRKRCSGTTYDRYRSQLHGVILPELGRLRFREVASDAGGVARLGDFMDGLEEDYAPETRRGIRTVVSGLCQTGVRHGALIANPCAQLDDIRGRGKKPVAYDPAQLVDFLRRFDDNQVARNADLLDLVRVLFCVGLRVGEALALRWKDLNLTERDITVSEKGETVTLPAHSLWVNGNIVHITGRGLVRNEGKTFRSRGVLSMPHMLVLLLLVRRPPGAADTDAVFPPPEGRLPWRYTSNVRRSIRTVRTQIGYPDFHSHVGRATVGTMLKSAGMTDLEIADYLRHADIRTTQEHYFARNTFNPGVGAVISDALVALSQPAVA